MTKKELGEIEEVQAYQQLSPELGYTAYLSTTTGYELAPSITFSSGEEAIAFVRMQYYKYLSEATD